VSRKTSILAFAVGAVLIVTGIAGSLQTAPRPAARPSPGAPVFAITNARVFDGERVIPGATVVVRDGSIVSVGGEAAPAGAETIDGTGQTLLPGLIDAHTHVFGDALERALVFGVTTELDMFTDHQFAARMRREQAGAGGARSRADLFSAGTLVTAPGGHGTEYGLQIPTIDKAAGAAAFVDARLAEGSDYIKIVYDDGASYARRFRSIDRDTLNAVVAAAKARNRLAVVHVGSRVAADHAVAAGASGLVHVFANEPPAADFAARMHAAGMFAIPTLTVVESTTGVGSGASVAADERLRPYLTAAEQSALGRGFPAAGSKQNLGHALAAVRQLADRGVPILAGTDAPNPGTSHGVSLHRELELLVRAGLTPAAALAAATSVPAAAFRLGDRGRIAAGLRADLVLVKGDPTQTITDTRNIVAVWKGGARVERGHAKEVTAPEAGTATGTISRFEGPGPDAEFGSWQVSTDSRMGGKSRAEMQVVPGGAGGSASALEVTGEIVPGAPFPWAGAMFFPAATPMQPVNVSKFKAIAFHARGDGREYQVMVFATRLGNMPAIQPFTAGPEWQEVIIPFSAFGVDGSDLAGILFSAGAGHGAFRFSIDELQLR
jgi:imidazolonepropionase-like amidohydrolase